jgi:arabinofuranosyltransferase
MLIALWWTAGRTFAALGVVGLWAGAFPVLAQIGRMGYYAAMVPNTALAKEAFGAFWGRGYMYLRDLTDPYWLIVPLLPLLVMSLRQIRSASRAPGQPLLVALMAGAILHAAYVVRLGGDFMHARMLLPALFAFVLPVTMWPLRPPRGGAAFSLVAQVVVLSLLSGWALLCGTTLRVPYRAQMAESGLADEVAFYRRLSGHPNPVTPDDYRGWRPGPVWLGDELRTLAAAGERVLVFDAERWPLTDGPPATVVTDGVVIGLAGYVAGPTVHIADTVGLTDPIASRLRLDERGRTGHEKWRLRDWLVARFVRRASVPPDPGGSGRAQVW